MSIFSFVKKAIGKVAKTGLSVATGGVSDKVISVAKTIGLSLKKAKKQSPQSQTALIEKIGQVSPRVRVTEIQDRMSAPLGIRRPRATTTMKRQRKARSVPRSTSTSPRKPRSAPKGGLDLKRIAAMWREAGKPGRWIDFIKANPIRKAA